VSREIRRKRWLQVREHLFQRPLYPAPEPMPRTRRFWLVMVLVTLAVLAFCVFYIAYMPAQQDALQTNAEDFGIMNQVLWNTTHGHMMLQSICNILSDTNCGSPAGISRLAIHFEPIMFPIAWLYALWSDPKLLFIIQTTVVALGAYPAFWLARLRLRNDWFALGIALLYLIYPAQLQATTSDFHAVTLTAALLLFTLYFMYTRRTFWLFVCALLAMACKENIPLVVATFGLWSAFFQRRWRSGLALTAIGILWFVLAVTIIMPHFSPTGQPMLSSRYGGSISGGGLLHELITHPRDFINSQHIAYIHILFAPAGYIPKPHGGAIFYLVLLAPWILVMALPSLAINLLSSNPQQYSGLFQYNAEIVPVIIFATIEALVVVSWFVRVVGTAVLKRRAAGIEQSIPIATDDGVPAHGRFVAQRRLPVIQTLVVAVLVLFALGSSLRTNYYFHGQLPYAIGFSWPQQDAHTALAQHFIDMIPPDASVSAQSKLPPHMSHRQHIYLFPYADTVADYVLLDVTGDIYPYFQATPYAGEKDNHGYAGDYTSEVKRVLASGKYGVVAAQDGYLLLKKGLPAPQVLSGSQNNPGDLAFALPASFCSNIYVTPKDVTNPVSVEFTRSDVGALTLVGYQVGASSPLSRANGYGTLTTYWRITAPLKQSVALQILLQGSDGRDYLVNTDIPELSWCPAQSWTPGSIVRITSETFSLHDVAVPNGLAKMSIALLPQGQRSSTISNVRSRLAVRVLKAPGATVTASQNTNVLQLMSFTIVN
jgi:Predicted membrane protein